MLLIVGIIIGAVGGWVAANVWANTPTRQVASPVFITHRDTGENYRIDQRVPNVAGLGSETVILYRLTDYSLEAWPGSRVDAEFVRQS